MFPPVVGNPPGRPKPHRIRRGAVFKGGRQRVPPDIPRRKADPRHIADAAVFQDINLYFNRKRKTEQRAQPYYSPIFSVCFFIAFFRKIINRLRVFIPAKAGTFL